MNEPPQQSPADIVSSIAPIPLPVVRGLIRTLVVDDSAFVRKVVREMLSGSPFIEVVGVARDGEEALRLVEELNPDVVTCDLTMPHLNGVAFVRAQMARRPLPILILSASPQDAEDVMQALAYGAVDFIRKPTALATHELLAVRSELVEKVKAAARVPLPRLGLAAASLPTRAVGGASEPTGKRGRYEMLLIGISTGGPQALRWLVPQLPRDFPVPVAIVLHMPVGYTAPFAAKLGETSQMAVREAKDGDRFVPGSALLAPAGRHLLVRRNAVGELVAQLSLHPLEKIHRPSVDVLFQSAAEVLGAGVLAVVMTGMGEDGKEGAAWVKAQGGTVITESKKSCIIYGMPRAVEEAGLSDASVPLEELAHTLSLHVYESHDTDR